MLSRTDRTTAVEELRRAVELVRRYTPRGMANDVAEVERRLCWVIEGLTNTRTCGRCGAFFTFDAVLFARRRILAPRTCRSCRKQR